MSGIYHHATEHAWQRLNVLPRGSRTRSRKKKTCTMTPMQRRLIRSIANAKITRWHPDNYAALVGAMQHAARLVLKSGR